MTSMDEAAPVVIVVLALLGGGRWPIFPAFMATLINMTRSLRNRYDHGQPVGVAFVGWPGSTRSCRQRSLWAGCSMDGCFATGALAGFCRGWNGRPIPIGHPQDTEGNYIITNEPNQRD